MTDAMRRFLLSALLVGAPVAVFAQHAGMQMPTNTLFVAQLDAAQAAGGSASKATGTGVFLLNPVERSLSYSLTYTGLGGNGAQSIALHNFGRGRDGPVIGILCGAGTPPCPGGTGATIQGQVERGKEPPLDNALIGEFDSGRVYVEILGADGKPEIRGQLGQNSAMVRIANYTAQLSPAAGVESSGKGTAVVSETYLPGGKVAVFYAVTVANTSGPPLSVGLTGVPPAPARPLSASLPGAAIRSAVSPASGGTITGDYQADAARSTTPLASRLLSAASTNSAPMLVVTTGRFRGGELAGTLVPVR